jgi:predicted Zn-dependent protease
MEVWSGLLLRAESEAELAFVLGHETGHYIGNDSAQALQATKSRATGALVFAALLGVAATAASYNATSPQQVNSINNSTQGLINAVYLGTVASLFSFDRQQETDADAFGFNAATNAGFDPTAGVSLWQRMIDEASSSDFQKVRNGTARTSVFDSHPVEADRVAAMKKLAGDKKGGESGKERYRATIRPFLNAWLRDDLRRRDFGETLFIIDRLAATKEDLGVLSFYRGETLRLRRKDGDAAKAEEAYRDAIRYDDAPAETWRQLADYSERRSENAEAARLLQAYLAKAPNASDAAFARMRLDRALGQSAAAPTSSAPAPAAPTPTTPSTPPAEPPASTVAVAATTLETPKAAGIAP